jgi:FlaA1/EpsC-like NDP-sugar epimerase
MKNFLKKGLLHFVDTFIIIFSVWLVFSLRLDKFYNLTEINYRIFIIYFIVFFTFFYIFRIYNIIITFFDFYSIKKIFKAILFSQLVLIFINIYTYDNFFFPRSVSIIGPIFIGIFITLSRIAINFLLNIKRSNLQKKNILIYGVNAETVLFSKNVRNYSDTYNIIGFFDLNNDYKKREINGIKIFNTSELENIINKNKIFCVFTQKSFILNNKNEYEKILKILGKYNIRIKSILNFNENLDFNLKKNSIDFFNIINKKKFKESNKFIKKNFLNKNILVTGAAGTIGTELTLKLIKLNPNKIFLLDNSEIGLFNLSNNVEVRFKKKIRILLGDCADANYIKTLSNYDIDYIFHAAAYKHVDMLENNIFSAVRNNIFSTINILDFALSKKIKKFVYISTDKAVEPSSILGITKKFGEILCAYYNSLILNKSIFTIVRFGNVIGSSGSALPIFHSEIINRKSVTVRNRNSKRYFMSVIEAVDLVLYSSTMNRNFNIYALEMGSQINIYSIAEKMIRVFGFNIKNKKYPEGDIAIKVINLKKGEKLEEEISLGKKLQKTSHPKIFTCGELLNIKNITNKIKKIKFLYNKRNLTKRMLFRIVNQ